MVKITGAFRLAALALGVAAGACGAAAAQTEGDLINSCASSLKLNEVNYQSSETVQLALLTYVTDHSSNDQEFKSNFSALTEVGWFEGSLSNAQKARRDLERKLDLRFTDQQATGLLTKSLSPEGASAFSKCIDTVFAKPGLHLFVNSSDETSTNVKAEFKTQPGEQRTFQFEIFSDGDLVTRRNLSIPPSGTQQSFVFTRQNPSRDLHLQIDVTSRGQAVDSMALFIPPEYKVERSVSSKVITSGVSKSTCGLNRDDRSYPGTDVDIRPEDGDSVLDVDTVGTKVTRSVGEQGKVPGAGSKIVVTVKSPDLVAAHALCSPGSSTDQQYWVDGVVSVTQRTTRLSTTKPVDNHVAPTFRMVSGTARGGSK